MQAAAIKEREKMEDRRSSTLHLNRTQKSPKSSLIRQVDSSSPTNLLFTDRQQEKHVENFVRTCPYHIEDIDRDAIVKRTDMDNCLKRLSTRDDVYGVIVATFDGDILYECDALKHWIPALVPLCFFARHLVRNGDPTDDIRALRLRTKQYEILVTISNEQLLVVMQMLPNPSGKDTNIENSTSDEDWETFLKRIKQREA